MTSRPLTIRLVTALVALTTLATFPRSTHGQVFPNGPLAEFGGVRGIAQDMWQRDLDDPFDFWNFLRGDEPVMNVGGWLQSGYSSQSTGLFNTHPDAIRMHQGWGFIEKSAAPRENRLIGLGGRFDLMYGVDAQDTQAFGNPPGTWDYLNGWDFGIYGWAIPQLYGEIATKNFSLIMGHFFTLVGYEVVTAPDNFFFSHSYTMYNSEPFTHTGALGTFSLLENLKFYAGWTAGWDTGFNNLNSGSNFLGGFSLTATDRVTLTYINTIGNFGAHSLGNNGYSHSCVADVNLTDKLNYVFQSDWLSIEGINEHNIGANQYLFYSLTERLALGTRFEWWKASAVTGFDFGGESAAPVDTTSYYQVTTGFNFRPKANCVVRPEFRVNWAPGLDYDEFIFGVDWITVF